MRVRNAEGILIAVIPDRLAGDIMNMGAGKWRSYQDVGKGKTQCYELTRDVEVGNRYNGDGGICIPLWTGYILVDEKY